MSDLEQASLSEIFGLLGELQHALASCTVYEAAAQLCMDRIFERFPSDLALVRTYVTAPYQQLPAANRAFVEQLAHSKGASLQPTTPVLSLVGSRGVKPEWNRRQLSAGHVGIPLVSAEFIAALPMIARMLSDFGAKLNWVERPEQGISTMRAGWSGLFYVPDAAATKDQNQRFIIPAQDFVREQNIRTVFGVGGAYSAGTLFAVILFCRRDLSRESAKRFMPLSSLFRTLTAGCVESGRIFASPS